MVQQDQGKFENELQDVLDRGHFSCVNERDVRRDVRGTHEIRNCNEAGERFLECCAANNLTL